MNKQGRAILDGRGRKHDGPLLSTSDDDRSLLGLKVFRKSKIDR